MSEAQRERRQRLIDAAFELGAEGGYDAVQMREVAATADVALATIYRLFVSKDHLLAAALAEWTSRLAERVVHRPPRGDTAADQMVDLLNRACDAMERQPKLSSALVRALTSPDAGAVGASSDLRRSIVSMGEGILGDLDPEVRVDILAVLGHVWYSNLVSWSNGRSTFEGVRAELERAARVLITPYESA